MRGCQVSRQPLFLRRFLYDWSLLDGDAPYRFAVAADDPRDIVEIPVDWTLDEWEQYAFYPGVTGSGVIESPAKVLEMWTLEAEAHQSQGSCFVLTNHPFIFGRPSKAVALEQLIERIKDMDGMSVTTMEQIAQHTKATATDIHTHARIEVPAFPGAGARFEPAQVREGALK